MTTIEDLDAVVRRPAATLRRQEIPKTPGVYAWYRDGARVHVGYALGAGGLFERIGKNDLGRSRDLSRSALRREVGAHLGIAPASESSKRPPRLRDEQVAPINAWIRECSVAWIPLGSKDEARTIGHALTKSWKSPLAES